MNDRRVPMRTRRPSVLASSSRSLSGGRTALVWLTVASALLVLFAAQWFEPVPLVGLLLIMVVASFGIVGAIVATRLPGNAIGWILWASGTFMGWSVAANTYANESLERYAGSLPGTVAVAWLSSVGIIPILCVTAIFVPLLFPDGHLPSPAWRGVAGFAGLAVGLATFINAIAPGTMSNGVAIQNPTAIPGLGPLPLVVWIAVVVSLAVSFVLAVASVVWRYRRGTSVERQQTRWFAGGVVLTLVAVVLGFSGIGPLADAGWLLVLAGLAIMPIAIGVAILRYRLYDLDRLVSRTISYGLLTGALVLAYAGLILVLQGPLGAVTGGSTLAIALSTLVVAALFQPIRRRLQRIVDRRFDRARYDAERTTTEFAERLRDEVDLVTLSNELGSTISRAVAPSMVGLWLRPRADR
jgi:hypothetical protein